MASSRRESTTLVSALWGHSRHHHRSTDGCYPGGHPCLLSRTPCVSLLFLLLCCLFVGLSELLAWDAAGDLELAHSPHRVNTLFLRAGRSGLLRCSTARAVEYSPAVGSRARTLGEGSKSEPEQTRLLKTPPSLHRCAVHMINFTGIPKLPAAALAVQLRHGSCPVHQRPRVALSTTASAAFVVAADISTRRCEMHDRKSPGAGLRRCPRAQQVLNHFSTITEVVHAPPSPVTSNTMMNDG